MVDPSVAEEVAARPCPTCGKPLRYVPTAYIQSLEMRESRAVCDSCGFTMVAYSNGMCAMTWGKEDSPEK